MEDNKKCTTIWLRPSVIRRMDAWLEEANCRSRSEFIEKAVRFYMGYLGTEDTSEYLSDALVATLRGIIADSTNRTNGQIRFEDAQDVQRQLPDDTWRD